MATRKVLSALTFATAAVSLLLMVSPAFADSHARIVRLSDTEGTVQLDRNTGDGFERAIMNMPVTQGMRLETGQSGRAEVEFENGSTVRLAEESSLDFTGLSLAGDGQRVSEVRLDRGTAYVNYKHKGGDDFRFDVTNNAITLDRDVHFRVRLTSGAAEIAVFKGELEVPGNGQTAKVKKDETFNLDLNDGARYTLAKGISSFDSDTWDNERNDYNTQYAASYNRNQYPYQYGYSDLNYYGSFFDAPGYGTLWRPFGASALFDPFGDGAWAYYPGFGYTWVSGYPWGWTPYRYGSWIYVPTYGWAWQPGGWGGWNPYPVVVNAPPTWHHPQPPIVTPGGGGSTVIVGNPVMTRPARPTGNRGMPTQSVVSGTGGTNTAANATATTDRPGRSAGPGATAGGSTQTATTATADTSRPSRTTTSSSSHSAAPASKVSTPPPAAHPTPAPRPVTPSRSISSQPHSSGMSSPHSSGMSSGSHASVSPSRPSKN